MLHHFYVLQDSQSLPRYHKKATRKQKGIVARAHTHTLLSTNYASSLSCLGLAVAVIGTLKIHSYFKPLCESAPTDQMEVEDSGVGTSASKEDSSSCTSSELTADPMVCSATASVDSMSLTISPKLLEVQYYPLTKSVTYEVYIAFSIASMEEFVLSIQR